MSTPTVEPRATTPGFAWRVPVLSNVPNVPADLTNLATDIEGTVKGRGARLVWNGASLAGSAGAWVRLTTAPASSMLTGGFTINAATAVVPVAGVYRISGMIGFTSLVATDVAQAAPGSESAVVWNVGGGGSLGAPVGAASTSVFNTLQAFAAGQRVGIWYTLPAARSMNAAELAVEWTGLI